MTSEPARDADLERSCEGCGYRRKVDLCGRFSFIKPHYLCAGCQKVLGAVRLGGYASNAHIDGSGCGS